MRIWVMVVNAALAVVAISPRVALAADPASSPSSPPAKKTARLVYSRGDLSACPDEEAMKNAVTARLGYEPFDPEAPQIITAEISQKGTSLRGQVDLRDRSFTIKGSRTLTSDKSDCAELASAMTLAISIAIDPMSITRPAPPPPPAPPAPAPAPVTPPENPRAAPPPPMIDAPPPEPQRRRFTTRVSVRAGAAYNATPGAAFLTQGSAGIGFEHVSFNVDVASTFASTESAPHGEVSASLLVFSLAPCFHLGVTKGCALVGLGEMMGSGKGVAKPSDDSSFYSNAGVRFGAEIPLSSALSIDATVDALAPLGRTRLLLNGSDVWSTPAVSFAFAVGMLLHL